MSNREFNPIFIVGFPRSGTTLLAVHLDRHSRISIPPETQFFKGVLPCGRPAKASGGHEGLITNLFNNWRVLDLELDQQEVLKRFKEYEPEYKYLLRAALETYAKGKGKYRPGEKSPIHLLYVPLIFDWYSKARVICIVRDGRDVVQSLMKVPWQRRKNLAAFCAEWNYRMNLVENYHKNYADAFYIVKYENFIASPEAELRKICDFIGEEFQHMQLDCKMSSRIVTVREKNWKNKALTAIDPSRVGAWKNVSSKDRLLMNKIMGKYLRQWGYTVEEQNLNDTTDMKVALQVVLYSPGFYLVRRYIYQLIKLFLCRVGLKGMLQTRDRMEKLSRKASNG